MSIQFKDESGWVQLSHESDESRNAQIKLNQILLSAMQMQNIMVLAGSGTSLGSVGGPSMGDLWDLCTKDAEGEIGTLVIKVASTVGHDTTITPPNIEEFLSRCESYLYNKEDAGVTSFVNTCKTKILDKCKFTKTDEKLAGHRTFIHRLSRRRVRDSRLKLFTTNYDTCFEEAASYQGIVVIDGFSFTSPRQYDPRFFDFDIVRRSPYTKTADNYLEGVFQLYKLHGSVNWARTNVIIQENEATADNACMIFPAKGKYQQSYIQPHLELMARYLAALREPNTCLIITGFGFNDDHLSEPIISAIKTNPFLKVIIADLAAETKLDKPENKYWKELGELSGRGADVLFINADFKDFAELIPDLQALTPAEKMANAVRAIAEESI